MPLIDMSETYQMTNVGDHIDGTDVYQSNRNLLDNAYFVGGGSQLGEGKFPINQREQTSYSGTYWGLDRWHVEGAAVIALAADGLQFYSTSSSDAAIFTQTLTTPVFGETVTCSAIINGTLAQVTYNVPQSGAFDLPATVVDGVYINLYCPLGTWVQFRIYTSNTTPCVIKSAKIESGTVSTLANDGPPDFWAQLEKCQRRFRRIKAEAPYYIFATVLAEAASYTVGMIDLPVSMASKPTISTNGSFRLWTGTGENPVTVSSIGIFDAICQLTNCSRIGIIVSPSANLTADARYDLQANNDANAYIDLSCEI